MESWGRRTVSFVASLNFKESPCLKPTNQVSSRPTSKLSTNNHAVCQSAPPLPTPVVTPLLFLRSLSALFCETGSLTGTWALLIRLDWWPVSPGLFLSPILCHKACNHEPHTWFLTWVLEPRLRPSHLLCKQFANQVSLQHLYLPLTF